MKTRRRLVFISSRFPFPADSGGKIRTIDILRGMKGGAFDIALAVPANPGLVERYKIQLGEISDEVLNWPEPRAGMIARAWNLLTSDLPASVAADRSRLGREAVLRLLSPRPDLVVADFIHSAVLLPRTIGAPVAVFAHNIETEIFERYAENARNGIERLVWRSQIAKMRDFEGRTLANCDAAITVSRRDADALSRRFGRAIPSVFSISTSVDLDYFSFASAPQRESTDEPSVVFVGSMDWRANSDAVEAFMDHVWPLISAVYPTARFTVVGRNPPRRLLAKARGLNSDCAFTGFVEDVRPYVRGAEVFVVPLRVGSGTRIKVVQAMAMGCPVVSTRVGVEGLELAPGRHYLEADTPDAFAQRVLELLGGYERRAALARAARHHVEKNNSSREVARQFESICESLAAKHSKTPLV